MLPLKLMQQKTLWVFFGNSFFIFRQNDNKSLQLLDNSVAINHCEDDYCFIIDVVLLCGSPYGFLYQTWTIVECLLVNKSVNINW